MRTLVWFRGKDLRVADHAPLADAGERGEVVPLFVLAPHFLEPSAARQIPGRMRVLLEAVAARAWKVDRLVAKQWTDPLGRGRAEQRSLLVG